MVEYGALLMNLKIMKEVRKPNPTFFSDSQVVMNQYQGSFKVKDTNLEQYKERVRAFLSLIRRKQRSFQVTQIGREVNSEADVSAKMVAKGEQHLSQPIPFGVISKPTIIEASLCQSMREQHGWLLSQMEPHLKTI